QLMRELGSAELGDLPDDAMAEALRWVGRAAERASDQERWLTAAALLDIALTLEPADVGLLLTRARARVGMHDAAGAAADLAALAQLSPEKATHIAALVVGGELARIQGDLAQATTVLEEALGLARELG